MLLSIETTGTAKCPAADIGYLFGKHPDRCQSTNLSFGQAHVFYPVATADRCRVCLLLEVDPVKIVRRRDAAGVEHYVNDRPYVASSYLSNAISQVFGSALNGRCKDRPELAETPLPLTATLDVLPVRGSLEPADVFGPLGYEVESDARPLDESFPDWGESPYRRVTVRGQARLQDLLTHLYVLVPAFDGRKHYFVDRAEADKLLARGGDWLAAHPLKEAITRRYLKHRRGLVRETLERLIPEDDDGGAGTPDEADPAADDAAPPRQAVPALPATKPLQHQRHDAVVEELLASGAASVADLGCAEGGLLRRLRLESQFVRIVGVDVSSRALDIAERRLKLDPSKESRASLLHASLLYRDARLAGFDAACLIEVVEHLDPPRLAAAERVVFEHARPRIVVLTTPNREYNVKWESLPAGQKRHADHRFEWTRAEFAAWCGRVADEHGYAVRYRPIGEDDAEVGPPTQMAVFTLNAV